MKTKKNGTNVRVKPKKVLKRILFGDITLSMACWMMIGSALYGGFELMAYVLDSAAMSSQQAWGYFLLSATMVGMLIAVYQLEKVRMEEKYNNLGKIKNESKDSK